MGDGESRFPALPPRPDPETGEPFPPHGRAFGGRAVKPEIDRDRETRLSHKPTPPEGMGPVFVWYKESKYRKITIYSCTFAILVVGTTVISFLDGDSGFDWLPYWQIWALIALGSLLPTAPLSYSVYSAGADWFKYDVVRFGLARRNRFVRLYELKQIACTWATSGWHLQLMDGKRGVDLPLMDYQHDRRMWDLIYNGILHSVAAGAKLDEITIKQLELNQVPELYNPTGTAEGQEDRAVDPRPTWARPVDRP